MRGSAAVLVCAICSACGGDGGTSDASEPRVYVVDNITAVSPFETFSSEVAFLDPTGRQIPGTRVSDPGSDAGQYGMVYAIMPDGGSLTVSAINIASPTSRRTDIWSIAGVKPGDRYVFDGNGISVNPPKLPADCVRRTITSFTVDATGTQASWNDADAASVDARMVHRSTGCPGGTPPVNCIFTDQVDSSTRRPWRSRPSASRRAWI